jgi:hypothetical protein
MEVINLIIMVIFTQSEVKLSIDQIEDVEKIVGLTFPKEYKDHLLEYNGGQCVPNIFSFNEKGNKSESSIDWFLAIYDGAYDNLKKYIEDYKIEAKRLPSHILPIAHDPGGNLICISCNNDDGGSIYFWDHENEVDYSVSANENYSNLYLIANGFNQFISSLK